MVCGQRSKGSVRSGKALIEREFGCGVIGEQRCVVRLWQLRPVWRQAAHDRLRLDSMRCPRDLGM